MDYIQPDREYITNTMSTSTQLIDAGIWVNIKIVPIMIQIWVYCSHNNTMHSSYAIVNNTQ